MTTIQTRIERRTGVRIMPDVSRETFQGYSSCSKLNTLFDYQLEAHGMAKRLCERVAKVENQQKKWKIVSGTIAVGSGFFGGAAAMLMKLKFWG